MITKRVFYIFSVLNKGKIKALSLSAQIVLIQKIIVVG